MTLIPINWRPEPREIRKFTLWLFVFCAAAAAVLFGVKGQPRGAIGVLAFGVVAALLGTLTKKGALPIYWFWMGVSFVMGLVISPIVFAVLFYLVLTPIGLLMRVAGRDRLALRRSPTGTYWREVPVKNDADRYQRQF